MVVIVTNGTGRGGSGPRRRGFMEKENYIIFEDIGHWYEWLIPVYL